MQFSRLWVAAKPLPNLADCSSGFPSNAPVVPSQFLPWTRATASMQTAFSQGKKQLHQQKMKRICL